MELPLISAQNLVFSKGEFMSASESERTGLELTTRKAAASLENLPNFGTGIKIHDERGDMSSGRDPPQGSAGKLYDDLLHRGKSLIVQINKYHRSTDGNLTLWTTKSNADCYEHLKKTLGGKLFMDVTFHLRLGCGNDEMSVIKKKAELFKRYHDYQGVADPTGLTFLLELSLDFTDPFLRTWSHNRDTFIGKLSVNLRLDENHLGEILHMGKVEKLENPLFAVVKRMRMDTTFTDATIFPGEGEGIKCHKIVLIGNSDYFRTMFETQMKEGVSGNVEIPDMTSHAVQALLDYFYCQDTTTASDSASIALKLLMKADEYSIENLEEAMLRLICARGNDWFPVSVALQLFEFARKKFENEGLPIYQLVRHKAAVVLKSKSKREIAECPEFRGLFKNAENGAELCTYLMLSV